MEKQKNRAHSPELNDLWLRLIGIPIVALLVPVIFFGREFGDNIYWISVCISMFYTALYWHICRFFFVIGNRRFTKLEETPKRLIWILVRVSVILLTFCNTVHFCIEPFFLNPNQTQLVTGTQVNAASFVMFFSIAGIYESRRYFEWLKTTLVEKERLEKENLASQLEGLKNQVNPHFLFNSLNTLVTIIPENPETAVRFVQKLSKVYRYILEIRDAKTTPLNNELEFLQAYIFLLKERFGENIIVKIDERLQNRTNNVSDTLKVSDTLQSPISNLPITEGVEIVPLSLQILLENAIKHNIISAAKPLTIELSLEKGDKLVVKNNLQRKNQVQDSTGVGLENIKTRYELVSDKRVEVIVTSQSFVVILPLLKVESSPILQDF